MPKGSGAFAPTRSMGISAIDDRDDPRGRCRPPKLESVLLLCCLLLLPVRSQAADPRWLSGPDLKPSDCAPHTELAPALTKGGYAVVACLPPAPQCAPGFLALSDLESASGWHCRRHPDCPLGTTGRMQFGKGWLCERPEGDTMRLCGHIQNRETCQAAPLCMWVPFRNPNGGDCLMRIENECPPGTYFAGLCCGGCIPIAEKSCKKLFGWKWVPRPWEFYPDEGSPGYKIDPTAHTPIQKPVILPGFCECVW